MDKVGAFASKKCLCCNNPWNGIEGVCNPCSKDNKGFTGLDIDNIDNSVNPAENFYLYSNGNWIKVIEKPSHYYYLYHPYHYHYLYHPYHCR